MLVASHIPAGSKLHSSKFETILVLVFHFRCLGTLDSATQCLGSHRSQSLVYSLSPLETQALFSTTNILQPNFDDNQKAAEPSG